MTEQWLPINGFHGYEVSNLGRVGTWRRGGARHALPTQRRILKPVLNRSGYIQCTLRVDGNKFTRNIHRLVLEAFVGPCPDGMECAHNNGNRSDARLVNLRWDTRKNNHFDKIRHGTAQRGENQWYSRLTKQDVLEIRKSGESPRELSIRFNVTSAHIHHIRKRKCWAWLADN